MPTARQPVGKVPPSKVSKAPAGKPSPGKAPASKPSSKSGKPGKKIAAASPPIPIKDTPQTRKAAAVIQKHARGLLARKQVKGIRHKQAEENAMQQEMETLRQQAYMAEVEYERKQEAKRRKKNEEEAKRRCEEARLRKALLEAAFDDELEDVQSLLKEASQYSDEAAEWADAHGNTLLSEAAAGGALSVCKYLLDMGCNPNTQGEFQRSPLWRASFLGKQDLVITLLTAGADPRIGNESGELPIHIGSQTVKEVLEPWDNSVTEELIETWRQKQEQKTAMAAQRQAQRLQSAEALHAEKCKLNETAQRALRAARCDLEKRIHEHDTCVAEGRAPNLIGVTLQMIKEQEAVVEAATATAKHAMEEWTESKQVLWEQQDCGSAGDGDSLPGEVIQIKQLEDIVLPKRHGAVSSCVSPSLGALVIDCSKRVSVFFRSFMCQANTTRNLGRKRTIVSQMDKATSMDGGKSTGRSDDTEVCRYSDSNYVNALSPHDMESNRLRRSVLGALRYGLLHLLIRGEIVREEHYKQLVKPEDGPEYALAQFREDRLALFRFVVTTSLKFPDERLLEALKVYRVKADT